MEDRELGINLIIDGTSYPLTIKASEEPYYRKAAHIVNDRLSTYKDLFMGEGGVRVMTMVSVLSSFTHCSIHIAGTYGVRHKMQRCVLLYILINVLWILLQHY